MTQRRSPAWPPGVTTHMALADTIVKDNRIPPRGFDNRGLRGRRRAGGGHRPTPTGSTGTWISDFPVPAGTVGVVATLYYQSLTSHYIEALRDGNVTDDWGDTLHSAVDRHRSRCSHRHGLQDSALRRRLSSRAGTAAWSETHPTG